MRKLLIALALVASACGTLPARPPQPVPIIPPTPTVPVPVPPVVVPPPTVPETIAFDLVACKEPPKDNYCAGPVDAVFRINIHLGPDDYITHTGDGNGYTYLTNVPPLPQSFIKIDAPGFEPFDTGTINLNDLLVNNDAGKHNFFTLKSLHFDPSSIPLEELAAIRGAMWTVRGPWDFGPRPNRPDNITALEYLYSYPPDVQKAMLATYRNLGYTHVAFGPINAQSYHAQFPDTDFTSPEMFEKWLDYLQLFWDNGLKPICFLHGDGQTFDQTKAMYDHLIRGNARAQRLMRIIVPSGWEPTRYDWSSRTWGAFFDWGHDLLPNALILGHTVADVDAMAGTDALYDDNGKGNEKAWAYVAPKIHGWLVQSGAFETPTVHGDKNHPERTNFDNWALLFSATERGSYYDRFHNGYAGWPTGSLWGSNKPIRIYAGEYCSYWEYWQNRPYDECTAWGDRAMKLGADGYLDSGTVAVPVRR